MGGTVMSLFDFFRTKKTGDLDKRTAKNNSNDLRNPSNFFAYLGSSMNELWQNIVEGENEAVDIFCEYKRFGNSLLRQYSNIDFRRQIEDFTIGELMYLYCLEFDKDIYISKSYDLTDVVLLSHHKYEELILKLTDNERTYITEFKNYIDNNIKRLCSSVSIKRFDVDFVKTTLPVNTLECVKYHQFLADADMNGTYNYGDKWNRISNAPIIGYFGEITKQDNPLILISIEHIDALVLDYICYATITLPTLDMDRVLAYRNPNTNKNVIMTIDETLGDGASVFADRAITDMNSAAFRQWVRIGMKAK